MSPEDEVFGGFSKKSLDRIRSSMRSEEVRVVDKVIFVRKLGSEYPHMADGEVEALLDRSCHEGIDIDAVVVLTDDKEYNLVLPRRIQVLKYMRILDRLSWIFVLLKIIDDLEGDSRRAAMRKVRHTISLILTLLEVEIELNINERPHLYDIRAFMEKMLEALDHGNIGKAWTNLQVAINIASIRLLKQVK